MSDAPDTSAALVTGAAHGIGRAVALRCAAQGRPTVLLDLDEQGLRATADELRGTGAQVVAHVGDVAARELVADAVQDAVGRFGRLGGLVAVAGIADVRPLLEMTDPDWQRVIDVNLTGLFRCTQEGARAMRETGGGSVVAIASTNGFWVEQNMAAYNTSKGGVIAFVRSAALDLAADGVRVNAVAPGVVRTRISEWVIDHPELGPEYLAKIPLGRFGEVDDVARAVSFLLGGDSAYITGQTLVLDGGLTLGMPVDAGEVVLPGTAREAG